MASLYINGELPDNGKLLVSLESATCLALVSFIDPPLTVFVTPPTTQGDSESPLDILFTCPPDLILSYLDNLPLPAALCRPPVVTLDDGISSVAGLSAVLRKIIQVCPKNKRGLLGFRESCLAAPFETSPFVWFCEVGMLRGDESALAQLELHLSLPIRIHNAGKYKELLEEGSRYTEGPHFLLTDIVCAVGISIILQRFPVGTITSYPNIESWLMRVKVDQGLSSVLELFEALPLKHIPDDNGPMISPISSLYKRDPLRCKSRHNNIFTQQADIDSSLNLLSSIKMMEVNKVHIISLPDSMPLPDVPSSRKERKTQQIQSFISAALGVCREGDIVVDFCAGSGHVGLALASCLPPTVQVVLLDAKEGSLTRAREKVAELGLNNVWLIQANLGYFTAQFQVGLALHACGVASDLMLHKCLEKGANIILCPCCYGSIKPNETLKYPQSEKYRETGLSQDGFIVLGHCADQETQQGERSMLAVDTDRCLAAAEKGYRVELLKMEPITCSTRNNLIIAVKE
nr:glutathione S-transferase 1 [Arma chinensis]